jgi:AcrR family transcriptional regulator
VADPAAGPDEPVEDDHRRGPRRRGAPLLDAVFAATLHELAGRGYRGLTVDAVAARAKVSKASIYRRWAGKPELVLAAVQAALPDPDQLPDTGSLRGDLLDYFLRTAAHLQGPAGPALRGVLGDVLADPGSAAELYGARSRSRTAARLRTLVRRAVDRGELPAGAAEVVTERQLEAGLAVVRHRYLWEGRISDVLTEQVVDEIVLPLLTHLQPGPREQGEV